MLKATATALLLPSLVAIVVAWGYAPSDGIRWSLYMASAAALAAIIGLIFGVPRARSEFTYQQSERYSSNANLEQISDWLTKLLVGAGLVELGNIPSLFARIGSYFGAGMSVPNAAAFSVAAVAYGSGAGFGLGYLWARLLLRFLFEQTEKFAMEESLHDQITSLLGAAVTPGKESEPEGNLAAVATKAVRVAQASSRTLPILWVDDMPENNTFLVEAFHKLGLVIDQVPSTDAALEALRRGTRTYGLIISDFGRSEDGQWHEEAGLELIRRVRQRDKELGQEKRIPIFIYATRRALARKADLESAGADLVTNQPGLLFERAVATCVLQS